MKLYLILLWCLMIPALADQPANTLQDIEDAISSARSNDDLIQSEKQLIKRFISLDTLTPVLPFLDGTTQLTFNVMLDAMANGFNYIGIDTSALRIMKSLYNSGLAKQSLIFKRKVLSKIVKICSFLISFLPEEPVSLNKQLISLGQQQGLNYDEDGDMITIGVPNRIDKIVSFVTRKPVVRNGVRFNVLKTNNRSRPEDLVGARSNSQDNYQDDSNIEEIMRGVTTVRRYKRGNVVPKEAQVDASFTNLASPVEVGNSEGLEPIFFQDENAKRYEDDAVTNESEINRVDDHFTNFANTVEVGHNEGVESTFLQDKIAKKSVVKRTVPLLSSITSILPVLNTNWDANSVMDSLVDNLNQMGVDTSSLSILKNIYNSGFATQHLLFKRKVLNQIIKVCNIIISFLPNESVVKNKQIFGGLNTNGQNMAVFRVPSSSLNRLLRKQVRVNVNRMSGAVQTGTNELGDDLEEAGSAYQEIILNPEDVIKLMDIKELDDSEVGIEEVANHTSESSKEEISVELPVIETVNQVNVNENVIYESLKSRRIELPDNHLKSNVTSFITENTETENKTKYQSLNALNNEELEITLEKGAQNMDNNITKSTNGSFESTAIVDTNNYIQSSSTNKTLPNNNDLSNAKELFTTETAFASTQSSVPVQKNKTVNNHVQAQSTEPVLEIEKAPRQSIGNNEQDDYNYEDEGASERSKRSTNYNDYDYDSSEEYYGGTSSYSNIQHSSGSGGTGFNSQVQQSAGTGFEQPGSSLNIHLGLRPAVANKNIQLGFRPSYAITKRPVHSFHVAPFKQLNLPNFSTDYRFTLTKDFGAGVAAAAAATSNSGSNVGFDNEEDSAYGNHRYDGDGHEHGYSESSYGYDKRYKRNTDYNFNNDYNSHNAPYDIGHDDHDSFDSNRNDGKVNIPTINTHYKLTATTNLGATVGGYSDFEKEDSSYGDHFDGSHHDYDHIEDDDSDDAHGYKQHYKRDLSSQKQRRDSRRNNNNHDSHDTTYSNDHSSFNKHNSDDYEANSHGAAYSHSDFDKEDSSFGDHHFNGNRRDYDHIVDDDSDDAHGSKQYYKRDLRSQKQYRDLRCNSNNHDSHDTTYSNDHSNYNKHNTDDYVVDSHDTQYSNSNFNQEASERTKRSSNYNDYDYDSSEEHHGGSESSYSSAQHSSGPDGTGSNSYVQQSAATGFEQPGSTSFSTNIQLGLRPAAVNKNIQLGFRPSYAITKRPEHSFHMAPFKQLNLPNFSTDYRFTLTKDFGAGAAAAAAATSNLGSNFGFDNEEDTAFGNHRYDGDDHEQGYSESGHGYDKRYKRNTGYNINNYDYDSHNAAYNSHETSNYDHDSFNSNRNDGKVNIPTINTHYMLTATKNLGGTVGGYNDFDKADSSYEDHHFDGSHPDYDHIEDDDDSDDFHGSKQDYKRDLSFQKQHRDSRRNNNNHDSHDTTYSNDHSSYNKHNTDDYQVYIYDAAYSNHNSNYNNEYHNNHDGFKDYPSKGSSNFKGSYNEHKISNNHSSHDKYDNTQGTDYKNNNQKFSSHDNGRNYQDSSFNFGHEYHNSDYQDYGNGDSTYSKDTFENINTGMHQSYDSFGDTQDYLNGRRKRQIDKTPDIVEKQSSVIIREELKQQNNILLPFIPKKFRNFEETSSLLSHEKYKLHNNQYLPFVTKTEQNDTQNLNGNEDYIIEKPSSIITREESKLQITPFLPFITHTRREKIIKRSPQLMSSITAVNIEESGRNTSNINEKLQENLKNIRKLEDSTNKVQEKTENEEDEYSNRVNISTSTSELEHSVPQRTTPINFFKTNIPAPSTEEDSQDSQNILLSEILSQNESENSTLNRLQLLQPLIVNFDSSASTNLTTPELLIKAEEPFSKLRETQNPSPTNLSWITADFVEEDSVSTETGTNLESVSERSENTLKPTTSEHTTDFITELPSFNQNNLQNKQELVEKNPQENQKLYVSTVGSRNRQPKPLQSFSTTRIINTYVTRERLQHKFSMSITSSQLPKEQVNNHSEAESPEAITNSSKLRSTSKEESSESYFSEDLSPIDSLPTTEVTVQTTNNIFNIPQERLTDSKERGDVLEQNTLISTELPKEYTQDEIEEINMKERPDKSSPTEAALGNGLTGNLEPERELESAKFQENTTEIPNNSSTFMRKSGNVSTTSFNEIASSPETSRNLHEVDTENNKSVTDEFELENATYNNNESNTDEIIASPSLKLAKSQNLIEFPSKTHELKIESYENINLDSLENYTTNSDEEKSQNFSLSDMLDSIDSLTERLTEATKIEAQENIPKSQNYSSTFKVVTTKQLSQLDEIIRSSSEKNTNQQEPNEVVTQENITESPNDSSTFTTTQKKQTSQLDEIISSPSEKQLDEVNTPTKTIHSNTKVKEGKAKLLENKLPNNHLAEQKTLATATEDIHKNGAEKDSLDIITEHNFLINFKRHEVTSSKFIPKDPKDVIKFEDEFEEILSKSVKQRFNFDSNESDEMIFPDDNYQYSDSDHDGDEFDHYDHSKEYNHDYTSTEHHYSTTTEVPTTTIRASAVDDVTEQEIVLVENAVVDEDEIVDNVETFSVSTTTTEGPTTTEWQHDSTSDFAHQDHHEYEEHEPKENRNHFSTETEDYASSEDSEESNFDEFDRHEHEEMSTMPNKAKGNLSPIKPSVSDINNFFNSDFSHDFSDNTHETGSKDDDDNYNNLSKTNLKKITNLTNKVFNNINKTGTYIVPEDETVASNKFVYVVVKKAVLRAPGIDEQLRLGNIQSRRKRFVGTAHFAGAINRFREISPNFEGFSNIPRLYPQQQTSPYPRPVQYVQKTHHPVRTYNFQNKNPSISFNVPSNIDHQVRITIFRNQNTFNEQKQSTSNPDGNFYTFKSLPTFEESSGFQNNGIRFPDQIHQPKTDNTEDKPDNGVTYTFKSLPSFREPEDFNTIPSQGNKNAKTEILNPANNKSTNFGVQSKTEYKMQTSQNHEVHLKNLPHLTFGQFRDDNNEKLGNKQPTKSPQLSQYSPTLGTTSFNNKLNHSSGHFRSDSTTEEMYVRTELPERKGMFTTQLLYTTSTAKPSTQEVIFKQLPHYIFGYFKPDEEVTTMKGIDKEQQSSTMSTPTTNNPMVQEVNFKNLPHYSSNGFLAEALTPKPIASTNNPTIQEIYFKNLPHYSSNKFKTETIRPDSHSAEPNFMHLPSFISGNFTPDTTPMPPNSNRTNLSTIPKQKEEIHYMVGVDDPSKIREGNFNNLPHYASHDFGKVKTTTPPTLKPANAELDLPSSIKNTSDFFENPSSTKVTQADIAYINKVLQGNLERLRELQLKAMRRKEELEKLRGSAVEAGSTRGSGDVTKKIIIENSTVSVPTITNSNSNTQYGQNTGLESSTETNRESLVEISNVLQKNLERLKELRLNATRRKEELEKLRGFKIQPTEVTSENILENKPVISEKVSAKINRPPHNDFEKFMKSLENQKNVTKADISNINKILQNNLEHLQELQLTALRKKEELEGKPKDIMEKPKESQKVATKLIEIQPIVNSNNSLESSADPFNKAPVIDMVDENNQINKELQKNQDRIKQTGNEANLSKDPIAEGNLNKHEDFMNLPHYDRKNFNTGESFKPESNIFSSIAAAKFSQNDLNNINKVLQMNLSRLKQMELEAKTNNLKYLPNNNSQPFKETALKSTETSNTLEEKPKKSVGSTQTFIAISEPIITQIKQSDPTPKSTNVETRTSPPVNTNYKVTPQSSLADKINVTDAIPAIPRQKFVAVIDPILQPNPVTPPSISKTANFHLSTTKLNSFQPITAPQNPSKFIAVNNPVIQNNSRFAPIPSSSLNNVQFKPNQRGDVMEDLEDIPVQNFKWIAVLPSTSGPPITSAPYVKGIISTPKPAGSQLYLSTLFQQPKREAVSGEYKLDVRFG